jgi:hypothetical protein
MKRSSISAVNKARYLSANLKDAAKGIDDLCDELAKLGVQDDDGLNNHLLMLLNDEIDAWAYKE